MINLCEQMEELRSTLIIGASRTGKDTLCWNAVERIKKKKELAVYYVDFSYNNFLLMSSPNIEKLIDYKEILNNYYSPDFLADCLLNFFDIFLDSGDNKLLILNEYDYMISCLNCAQRKEEVIKSIVSVSNANKVWILAQRANQEHLYLSEQDLEYFSKILLVKPGNCNNYRLIVPPEDDIKQSKLMELSQLSSVGIVAYCSALNGWFPCVTLKRY